MQVSVETTQGLERKMTLQIPAEDIDPEVEKRVVDTAKKARLPGFRPGKIPRKVVIQRFGDALRQEVVGEVAARSCQQAIEQESLNPVSQPSINITRNEAGESVELTAVFEVFPEVELGDLSTIKLERLVAEVGDADVDAMIQKLREQRADYVDVQRAAADTDRVNIDYVGKKDGEAFDGGTASGQDLVLGSGQMIEGFEDGIVGASAGEQRQLNLTFPEKYHAEELAGQAVTFDVTVNAVQEQQLPELDDELFKTFEVDGGLDEFKAKVGDNMKTQLEDAIAGNLKKQVMDGLVELHSFDIPAAMIGQEIEAMRQSAVQRIGGGGMADFDASILPDEMFAEQANHRVALGIILTQVVSEYEIKPGREELTEFIDGIAASYEDPESVRNAYLADENLLQQVNLMVVEKMVVDKVVELAGATDKTSSYDDVLAASQG